MSDKQLAYNSNRCDRATDFYLVHWSLPYLHCTALPLAMARNMHCRDFYFWAALHRRIAIHGMIPSSILRIALGKLSIGILYSASRHLRPSCWLHLYYCHRALICQCGTTPISTLCFAYTHLLNNSLYKYTFSLVTYKFHLVLWLSGFRGENFYTVIVAKRDMIASWYLTPT